MSIAVRRSRRDRRVIALGLMLLFPTICLAGSTAPEPPIRAGVNIQFVGQAPSPSAQSAIGWSLQALGGCDRLPLKIDSFEGGGLIFFADSTWSGIEVVPNGVMDATVGAWWIAPGCSPPYAVPEAHGVSIASPQVTNYSLRAREPSPQGQRFELIMDPAPFTLTVDDGSHVYSERAAVTIELRSMSPTSWRVTNVYVLGCTLDPPARPAAAAPVDQQTASPLPLHPLMLALRDVTSSRATPLVFDVTLPLAANALLELFDLQGRRTGRRVVDGSASLHQRIALADVDHEPGVYGARLSQGEAHVSQRVVVLR